MHASELNTARSSVRSWSRYWPRNSAAVAVISIEVRTRRSQVGSPTGADGDERAFPLRAVQQLTDLQRIALGSVMKLSGDIA